ncbi:hypothetical protein MR829_11290 [Paracoccus versutus]|uniref:hypothetical protein n=1 Tax=Paracoccus versutus TaxID=34007 RepID=UPI001FB5FE0F|nr:hypothetical protein [Paracoccus versutus]MCJ1900957.1 hypothetical protein [Paracoccus versutus]
MRKQAGERELPIYRPDGAFDDRAPFIILGYMLNPSDEFAAGQFANILRDENMVARAGPSAVTREVVTAFSRRKNRGDVAGYTLLMMAHLEAEGGKVSLGRAQTVTEAFLGDVDAQFKAGIPQNMRDIRKHFDTYRDVAHLWATKIAFPEKWMGMTDTLFDLLDFLAHARVFEDVLRRCLDPKTPWSPWRVPQWIPTPAHPIEFPRLKDEYLEVAHNYSRRWGA